MGLIENKDTNILSNDTISRQAAIDAMVNELSYLPITTEKAYEIAEVLNDLPSAQPEQQWIPCSERLPNDNDYRGCMECLDGAVWYFTENGAMGLGYYYESTKEWSTTDDLKTDGKVIAWMPLPEPYMGGRRVSDMMTFPETWEEFEKFYGFNDFEEIYTNGSRLIPSFRVKQWLDHEPERKKGKWIKNPEYIGDEISGFIDNHFSCSECKKEAEINSWGFYILSDFCPNCGADMRGDSDE